MDRNVISLSAHIAHRISPVLPEQKFLPDAYIAQNLARITRTEIPAGRISPARRKYARSDCGTLPKSCFY